MDDGTFRDHRGKMSITYSFVTQPNLIRLGGKNTIIYNSRSKVPNGEEWLALSNVVLVRQIKVVHSLIGPLLILGLDGKNFWHEHILRIVNLK